MSRENTCFHFLKFIIVYLLPSILMFPILLIFYHRFRRASKKQHWWARQLSIEFWVRLLSSVSTTFKHSSANSINSGSSIANFIAFQAFGAESTSFMKSRKCLFFSRSLRLSLFAKWKRIQNISGILLWIVRWWKFLTKLGQFIWMHCIFGCELQDFLSRLLGIYIFSVVVFVHIERRWTFDVFVFFETFERTAVNQISNSFISKTYDFYVTYQYWMQREHLYFLDSTGHSKHFIFDLFKQFSKCSMFQHEKIKTMCHSNVKSFSLRTYMLNLGRQFSWTTTTLSKHWSESKTLSSVDDYMLWIEYDCKNWELRLRHVLHHKKQY